MELRAAAIRFEAQQRLFTELGASMAGSGRGHGVFQVQEDQEVAEGEEYPEDLYVEAVGKGTSKCHRCGKAGHIQKECPTDMTQVKCFRCGQAGHIGSNCRSPKAKAKALPKAKPKAGNKGSPRKTTKGKGGGKGKKGKLNEIGEAEEGEEPEQEWAEEDQEEEEWPEESGTVSGVLMMPLFVRKRAMGGCIGCLILALPAQCWLSRTRSATSGFPEVVMYLEGIWLRMGHLFRWERKSWHLFCSLLNAVMALRILRSSSWNATLGRLPTISSAPLSS